MIVLRLLALCLLIPLAACDTTSWGTPATSASSFACTSLSANPPNTEGLSDAQKDRVESQAAPMC